MCRVTVLTILAILTCSNTANAAIIEAEIRIVKSPAELAEASKLTIPDDSDFSIFKSSRRGVTGGNVREYGNPTRSGQTMTVGDYFLLCFRPTVDMYVRIYVFDDEGDSYPIYPDGIKSPPRILGDRVYCLGDRNTPRSLPALAPGRYTIWIYGGNDSPPRMRSRGRPQGGRTPSQVYEESLYFRIVD